MVLKATYYMRTRRRWTQIQNSQHSKQATKPACRPARKLVQHAPHTSNFLHISAKTMPASAIATSTKADKHKLTQGADPSDQTLPMHCIIAVQKQQATCVRGDHRATSPPLLGKQRYIADPPPSAPSQFQPLARQPLPWLLLLRQPPWPAQLLLLQPTQPLLAQQCQQAPQYTSTPRKLPRPMPQAHPVSACW